MFLSLRPQSSHGTKTLMASAKGFLAAPCAEIHKSFCMDDWPATWEAALLRATAETHRVLESPSARDKRRGATHKRRCDLVTNLGNGHLEKLHFQDYEKCIEWVHI